MSVVPIDKELFDRLNYLGIIPNETRDNNVGTSDYSTKKHLLQPWTIQLDHNLNYWDGDIIKRVLRTKTYANMTPEESRIQDYEKIIHICNERIRQIKAKK